ncbi:Protein argonaute 4A [Platanthera guangdongensis]|uniref:Protein argonaute 4A n=1 Tax=Platanthera guangdongensis TaxID=2320717 RepID=A0ABR2MIT3_9ASPA
MRRESIGTRGERINLITNHFKVSTPKSGDFYHYNVTMTYEDDKPVVGKGIGRRVIQTMQENYGKKELAGKAIAYDGDKSLFTIGPLPEEKNNFIVMLNDIRASRPSGDVGTSKNVPPKDGQPPKPNYGVKTIKVELRFATKLPIGSILSALQGRETDSTQEALRVLDIVLRQNAAKRECMLVRQSFYDKSSPCFHLGGHVQGCPGYHMSFRTTKDVLSLNVDVSTTITIQPGPVIEFLLQNQNCKQVNQIDWPKANRLLKNLRVKINNQEYKIIGFSEKICAQQTFTLNPKAGEVGNPVEITVQEYFRKYRNLQIQYANLPCLNVGKPKRPTYYPIELCTLLPLQRYKKALTVTQRSALVENSRQKPNDRLRSLNHAMNICNYESDPFLRECGVRISPNFTQVVGRVLQTPKLKAGNSKDIFIKNGRWNFNEKTFIAPVTVKSWFVVNFSAQCDSRTLIGNLMRCGEMKGMRFTNPNMIINEERGMWKEPAAARVESMIMQARKICNPKSFGETTFILCILAERKNSDVYGPWKKKCLSELGFINQCIAPTRSVNDQYFTNVLLKINAKLGGLNSQLLFEINRVIPMVSNVPTLIIGMDVSHPAPGRDDVPSIAAVVGSREWPFISKYRAVVRSQSSRVEMIDALYKPLIRDGVSESQFNQVLNIELDQIIEFCNGNPGSWPRPKFTVIIAQKNHYTRFFHDTKSPYNVPPGTLVDTTVCHPSNYDFYMCPHAGMIGTSRPTHYHVLLDENKFTADQLQEFIHSLSYTYQRSTSAISIVAPVLYAHMAAAQVAQFEKFEDRSETASRTSSQQQGSSTAAAAPRPVPQLPKLHEKVRSSMFFC